MLSNDNLKIAPEQEKALMEAGLLKDTNSRYGRASTAGRKINKSREKKLQKSKKGGLATDEARNVYFDKDETRSFCRNYSKL